MRTALIILALSSLSAFGQAFSFNDHEAWLAQQKAAIGGCAVNTGDLMNQSFEGSVSSGWTVFGTGATWGDTFPGTSPCSGLGTKTLGAATTAANTAGYYYDFGSISTAARYWRFYFYADSTSQASTDKDYVFRACEQSGILNVQASVVLINTAGQLQLMINTASGNSSTINVSAATWYRVEIETQYNTTCTLHVYNAAGVELSGSPVTQISSGNNGVRYGFFGIVTKDNSQNATFHIDGVGASSVTWLGQ